MKLKIALVGSSKSGKSQICNILSNEQTSDIQIESVPYRPTHSLRIIPVVTSAIELRKVTVDIESQIWEIGGNPKLKSIWPCVEQDMDGVIITYKTNEELGIREGSGYHFHFVTNLNLHHAQVFIIGNNMRGARESGPQKIVGANPRTRHIAINIEDDTTFLKSEYREFIRSLAQVQYDKENNSFNP